MRQLTKILLVPPKCEILSGTIQSFILKHYDSNIDIFAIAPCKVIALNVFASFFGIISLLLYLFAPPKFIALPCLSFSLFEVIAKRFPLNFAIAFDRVKE